MKVEGGKEKSGKRSSDGLMAKERRGGNCAW